MGNNTETTEYKHTEDMGEISGFGGGYEEECQNMLDTGVKWLLTNPDQHLEFMELKEVYGLVMEKNPPAKALSKAITEGRDCTGAMHHAVIKRLTYIAEHGWDAYCTEVRKNEEERESA